MSAPLPAGVISWRQDGRPVQRDGKYFARFVAYVDANTVRERLDGVVPGEWDLTLDLLPTLPSDEQEDATCSFKARLQILGSGQGSVSTRAILTELPTLAREITHGTFQVDARAVPLADVERAWADAATSSQRIVLTPEH